MGDMDTVDQIVSLLDALSHDMDESEYRELLEEIASEIELRLVCLHAEDMA